MLTAFSIVFWFLLRSHISFLLAPMLTSLRHSRKLNTLVTYSFSGRSISKNGNGKSASQSFLLDVSRSDAALSTHSSSYDVRKICDQTTISNLCCNVFWYDFISNPRFEERLSTHLVDGGIEKNTWTHNHVESAILYLWYVCTSSFKCEETLSTDGCSEKY